MRADKELTTARALIARHGLQAAAVAQERAEQSRARGNREEAADWRGVVRTVMQLRAERHTAPREAAE